MANWKQTAITAHAELQAEQERERAAREIERRQELIDGATGHMLAIGLSPDDMNRAEWQANGEYGIYFTLDGVGFVFRPRNWHSTSNEADYVSLVSAPCPVCGAQRVSQFTLYRSATLADLGRMLSDPPKLADVHEAHGEDEGVMCDGEMKLYPEKERA